MLTLDFTLISNIQMSVINERGLLSVPNERGLQQTFEGNIILRVAAAHQAFFKKATQCQCDVFHCTRLCSLFT